MGELQATAPTAHCALRGRSYAAAASLVVTRVMISAGVGSVASAFSVPQSLSSMAFTVSAFSFEQSISMWEVGRKPLTLTGEVEHSQLKVMASGLSLMLA